MLEKEKNYTHILSNSINMDIIFHKKEESPRNFYFTDVNWRSKKMCVYILD